MRVHSSIVGLMLALAVSAGAIGADVLAQLGIPLPMAREAIGSVITAGIYNPGLPAQAFKLLPPAARAQAVNEGVAWLRAYVESPEFARQYAQVRQSRKPDAPAWELTPEQELQKADEDQRQQLEESKRVVASLPPEQRKAMEDALKSAADQTARSNTPEARQTRLAAIKARRADDTKEYEAAVASWTQTYPENPRPLVARRLREFLRLSADVDFNAGVNAGSVATFTNPAYQAKSSQWKMCYRAGREATTAARTAVQAWLTALGG